MTNVNRDPKGFGTSRQAIHYKKGVGDGGLVHEDLLIQNIGIQLVVK